jgi:hypothetical protein
LRQVKVRLEEREMLLLPDLSSTHLSANSVPRIDHLLQDAYVKFAHNVLLS